MRKRRRAWQHTLWDGPIYSHRAATTHIGHFFEELVAKVMRGQRVTVEEDATAWNPDVVLRSGRELEVKASNRGSWMMGENQLQQMAHNLLASVLLVRYRPGPGSLWNARSLGVLHAQLLSGPIDVYELPAALLGARMGDLKRRVCWGGSRIIRLLTLPQVLGWFDQPDKTAGLTGSKKARIIRTVRVCGADAGPICWTSGLKYKPAGDSDVPF